MRRNPSAPANKRPGKNSRRRISRANVDLAPPSLIAALKFDINRGPLQYIEMTWPNICNIVTVTKTSADEIAIDKQLEGEHGQALCKTERLFIDTLLDFLEENRAIICDK
jgi:hypothetical protein